MAITSKRGGFVPCLVGLWLFASGCVIGTWPTPDDGPGGGGSGGGGGAIKPEACDAIDNDGDGAIDEGCGCDDDVRGCFGVDEQGCGIGLQWCLEGVWQECTDLGPPRQPAVSGALVLEAPTQASLDDDLWTLSLTVTPPCPRLVSGMAELSVAVDSPDLRLVAAASGDGTTGDTVGFAAAVPNPFGPGVASQPMRFSATVLINGEAKTRTREVSWSSE